MRHTLVNRLLAAILTLAIFAAACDGGELARGLDSPRPVGPDPIPA